MLVLTRKVSESIMIGDDIEVTVIRVAGDKVRFGINAPTSVAVHRKEVFDEIQRENRAAMNPQVSDLAQAGEKLSQKFSEKQKVSTTT